MEAPREPDAVTWSRGGSSPRRLAALLIGGSLLITSAFPLVRAQSPFRTSGGQGTDLASHWGSALLLMFEGAALYRVPSRELCAHPALAAPPWRDPSLTCAVRGHPGVPAFVVNWPQYPRVYPPGCQLLLAPLAAMYFVGAPFSWVNALAMVVLLVFAHLATLLFAGLFWRSEARALRVAGLAFVAFAHAQLMVWALGGKYDVIPLAALLAGVFALRERRVVVAFVCISAAQFLHYRVLWYVPLLAWAASRVLASWPSLSRRERVAVAAAAGALLLSGVTFLLSWSALHTFPERNVLRSSPGFAVWLVPGLVLGALAATRSWLTLSCVAWQLLVMSQTRELRPWHVVLALPMVAVSTLERRALLATAATVTLVCWLGEAAFGSRLFSTDALLNLFAG